MNRPEARWVVIHIARSEEISSRLQKKLSDEGFLVRAHPVSRDQISGESYYEILALTSEAREARELLQELGF